ncbi:hypothetical protein ACFFRR_004893 [Megaselia abdita]
MGIQVPETDILPTILRLLSYLLNNKYCNIFLKTKNPHIPTDKKQSKNLGKSALKKLIFHSIHPSVRSLFISLSIIYNFLVVYHVLPTYTADEPEPRLSSSSSSQLVCS